MIPLKFLPTVPFTWNIVGPTNCGKTFMLCETLRSYIKNGVFREQDIHLFCPTLNQESYKQFTKINTHKVYDPAETKKIEQAAEHILEEYGMEKMPHILLIYDDCFSSDSGNNAMRSKSCVELATHGRHYNISQILLSQHLYGISKAIRHNGQFMSMFRPSVMGAAEDFFREMVAKDLRPVVWTAANRVWDKKYGFVHMLTSEKTKERFREGFTKLLLNEKELDDSSDDSDWSYSSDSVEEINENLKRKREGALPATKKVK